MIKWSGAVASAIRGRRGQAFLREMLEALDAIPVRELILRDIETLEGVCAIGAVARQRRLDVTGSARARIARYNAVRARALLPARRRLR